MIRGLRGLSPQVDYRPTDVCTNELCFFMLYRHSLAIKLDVSGEHSYILKLEAVLSSETSAILHTLRPYNPEL
jgi:hypothetical protein